VKPTPVVYRHPLGQAVPGAFGTLGCDSIFSVWRLVLALRHVTHDCGSRFAGL
jgi:hypothetical protein